MLCILHGRDQFTSGAQPRWPCYAVLDLELARHAQTILAHELHAQARPLPHGAPLRLRVETELGDNMVKYLRCIEVIAEYQTIGGGQGGSREEARFFGRGAEM